MFQPPATCTLGAPLTLDASRSIYTAPNFWQDTTFNWGVRDPNGNLVSGLLNSDPIVSFVPTVPGVYTASVQTETAFTFFGDTVTGTINCQGANQFDLNVSSVDISQALTNFNQSPDGSQVLVEGKSTVLVATVSATNIPSGHNHDVVGITATLSRDGQTIYSVPGLLANSDGSEGNSIELGSISTPASIRFYFNDSNVPNLSGPAATFSVKAVPMLGETNTVNNEVLRSVKFVQQAGMAVTYISMMPPGNQFSPPDPSASADEISHGNDFLIATYPIAKNAYKSFSGQNAIASDVTFHGPYSGFVDEGVNSDAKDVCTIAKRSISKLPANFGPVKPFGVGLVDPSYFLFHNIKNVAGVAPDLRPEGTCGVLVVPQSWQTVAHEIKHNLLGLGEKYGPSLVAPFKTTYRGLDIRSGFWVDNHRSISANPYGDASFCKDGNGSAMPTMDFMTFSVGTHLNCLWVDTDTYSQLFGALAIPQQRSSFERVGTIIVSGTVTISNGISNFTSSVYKNELGSPDRVWKGRDADVTVSTIGSLGQVLASASTNLGASLDFIDTPTDFGGEGVFTLELPYGNDPVLKIRVSDRYGHVSLFDPNLALLRTGILNLPSGSFANGNGDQVKNHVVGILDQMESLSANSQFSSNASLSSELGRIIEDQIVPTAADGLEVSKDELLGNIISAQNSFSDISATVPVSGANHFLRVLPTSPFFRVGERPGFNIEVLTPPADSGFEIVPIVLVNGTDLEPLPNGILKWTAYSAPFADAGIRSILVTPYVQNIEFARRISMENANIRREIQSLNLELAGTTDPDARIRISNEIQKKAQEAMALRKRLLESRVRLEEHVDLTIAVI